MKNYTPYEAATALELEARRQKLSYGRLVANTDPWRQDEIIAAYMKRKRVRRRGGRSKGRACADCARWQPDPQSRAGGSCPFPLKGSDLPKYKSRKDRTCTKFTAKER